MNIIINRISIYATALLLLLTVAGCTVSDEGSDRHSARCLTLNVMHPGQTRATETAFEQGDEIGLYVALGDSILEIGGNLVNNEKFTCYGGMWKAERTIYWSEGTYTAYAYYPYMKNIESIWEQPFSVYTNQTAVAAEGNVSASEASDLLFAKAENLTGETGTVTLMFRHVMSKLKIRLVKGEDYKGELPENADVFVHNTITDATIDFAEGVATPLPKGRRQTIKAKKDGQTSYSAIIVPQRVGTRTPLVEVVLNGISCLFESRFVFKPGIEHVVNVIINNNPENIKIDINGNQQEWK